MDRIAAIREALMGATDSVCLDRAWLATESHRRHAEEPLALCRAHLLADTLGGMRLDLLSNPYFAGSTSTRLRAWVLFPEHGLYVPDQALVENPSLERLLDGEAVPGAIREYWADRQTPGGVGHLVPEYPRVLQRGLLGVIQDIGALPAADDEGMTYREACRVACQAVIDWAGRFAREATKLADASEDTVVTGLLRRVARACAWVPAHPARDLFEALQAILLVHLAIHLEGHSYSVSLGRLDQLLLPYWRDSADDEELLAAFILKCAAISVNGSHSKTQAVTLAGQDQAGRDASNSLTLAWLRAFARARVPDPHVFVRWHAGLVQAVKRQTLEMLSDGMSMPMMVGDEQTIAGLEAGGVAHDDAVEYCIVGCNELGIPGKLIWESMLLIGIEVLRGALLKLDPETATLVDLERCVVERMRDVLRREGDRWLRRQAIRRLRVTPFTSSLMDGCAERGRDLHIETTYPVANLCERGFTNWINGMVAVEQVLWIERRCSVSDLQRALLANFDDNEPLRLDLESAIRRDVRGQRARHWAQWWMAQRNRVLAELQAEGCFPRALTCHVVRSLHHVDGERILATPDGRRAGEPLADSIGPLGGVSPNGPTGVLESVMPLAPATNWTGGYNLNWTLSPQALQVGPHRSKTLAAIDTFFEHGGQELQINALDAEVLEDAQRFPERYPGLLVRIAGFNALFAQLSRVEQSELIERARAL